jgi:hypothetical protein
MRRPLHCATASRTCARTSFGVAVIIEPRRPEDAEKRCVGIPVGKVDEVGGAQRTLRARSQREGVLHFPRILKDPAAKSTTHPQNGVRYLSCIPPTGRRDATSWGRPRQGPDADTIGEPSPALCDTRAQPQGTRSIRWRQLPTEHGHAARALGATRAHQSDTSSKPPRRRPPPAPQDHIHRGPHARRARCTTPLGAPHAAAGVAGTAGRNLTEK